MENFKEVIWSWQVVVGLGEFSSSDYLKNHNSYMPIEVLFTDELSNLNTKLINN